MILFNEDAWPCDDPTYREQVERGYARMAESSVAVLSLARDIEPFVCTTWPRLWELNQLWKSMRFYVYENDSTDNTVALLRDCPLIHCLGSELLGRKRISGRSQLRAEHLAEYRGRLQKDWITFEGGLQPYVLVLDLDLPGGFSYDGLAHSIGDDREWDLVGSNGLKKNRRGQWQYHDVWAFRRANHPWPHSPMEINSLRLRRGDEWLPVRSCGGGMILYKGSVYREGVYAGGDCEHAMFHESLWRRGFRNFFCNPNQITLYS